MSRKLRELIRDLERAGFVDRGGRGSHRNYQHPQGGRVTLSGNQGDDAKPYQEREVRQAIADSLAPADAADAANEAEDES